MNPNPNNDDSLESLLAEALRDRGVMGDGSESVHDYASTQIPVSIDDVVLMQVMKMKLENRAYLMKKAVELLTSPVIALAVVMVILLLHPH